MPSASKPRHGPTRIPLSVAARNHPIVIVVAILNPPLPGRVKPASRDVETLPCCCVAPWRPHEESIISRRVVGDRT